MALDEDRSLLDEDLGKELPMDNPEKIVYEIIEGGSQQGKDILVDNRGHSYNVNRISKLTIFWSCSVRNRSQRCPATVSQRGELFSPGKIAHCHPGKPGMAEQVKMAKELKKKATQPGNIFTSTGKIIESVLCELRTGNPSAILPDPAALVRRTNRARQSASRQFTRVSQSAAVDVAAQHSQTTDDVVAQNGWMKAVTLKEPLLDEALPEVDNSEQIVYEIIEGGSLKGKDILVDNRGHSYNVKRLSKRTIFWGCSVRNQSHRCTATVSQRGNTFIPCRMSHCHPGKPGIAEQLKIAKELKEKAKQPEYCFTSAGKMVESVLSDMKNDNPSAVLPNPATLVRRTNRARQLASRHIHLNQSAAGEVKPQHIQVTDDMLADHQDGSQVLFLDNEPRLLARQEDRPGEQTPYEIWDPHEMQEESNIAAKRKRDELKKSLIMMADELAVLSRGDVFVRFVEDSGKEWAYCNEEDTWETYVQHGLCPMPHQVRMDGTGHPMTANCNRCEGSVAQNRGRSGGVQDASHQGYKGSTARNVRIKQEARHCAERSDIEMSSPVMMDSSSSPSHQDTDATSEGTGSSSSEGSDIESEDEGDPIASVKISNPFFPKNSTRMQSINHSRNKKRRRRRHITPEQFYVLHGNVLVPLNQRENMPSRVTVPSEIYLPPKRKRHATNHPMAHSSSHRSSQHHQPHTYAPIVTKQRKSMKKKQLRKKGKTGNMAPVCSASDAVITAGSSHDTQVIELTLTSDNQGVQESPFAVNHLVASDISALLPDLPQEAITVVECPVDGEVTVESQNLTACENSAVLEQFSNAEEPLVHYVKLIHNYGIASTE